MKAEKSVPVLVIASRNQGKVVEMTAGLQGLPLKVRSLVDFPGAPIVQEDGITFQENAEKKAVAISRYTGLLTLADDSGLEVEYLEGRPGVYSSRYAGEDATDGENNYKLLLDLMGVPPVLRKASFRCVLVIATPEGKTAFVEGSCQGIIAQELRGTGGFGYDPLFICPEREGRTFGELSAEEKGEVSHRARAIKKLRDILPSYLHT